MGELPPGGLGLNPPPDDPGMVWNMFCGFLVIWRPPGWREKLANAPPPPPPRPPDCCCSIMGRGFHWLLMVDWGSVEPCVIGMDWFKTACVDSRERRVPREEREMGWVSITEF